MEVVGIFPPLKLKIYSIIIGGGGVIVLIIFDLMYLLLKCTIKTKALEMVYI